MTRKNESEPIAELAATIRACRTCRDSPLTLPLPHQPRPVVQLSASARLCIAGQAPGKKVHESGVPFLDRSGDRLRDWLGIDAETFYDASRVAIVPMGFCFPGYDAKGSDLPPRRECAPLWRLLVFDAMPQVELVLAIGQYAQHWHLGQMRRPTLTETVANWCDILASTAQPRVLPLPHPSWRNTGWLKRNPWFESELVPVLQREVAKRV